MIYDLWSLFRASAGTVRLPLHPHLTYSADFCKPKFQTFFKYFGGMAPCTTTVVSDIPCSMSVWKFSIPICKLWNRAGGSVPRQAPFRRRACIQPYRLCVYAKITIISIATSRPSARETQGDPSKATLTLLPATRKSFRPLGNSSSNIRRWGSMRTATEVPSPYPVPSFAVVK